MIIELRRWRQKTIDGKAVLAQERAAIELRGHTNSLSSGYLKQLTEFIFTDKQSGLKPDGTFVQFPLPKNYNGVLAEKPIFIRP